MTDKVSLKLDLSALLDCVKRQKLMLYPVLVFLLSKAFNSQYGRHHTCYQTLNHSWDLCAYQDDFEAFYHLYFSRSFEEKTTPLSKMPSNVFQIMYDESVLPNQMLPMLVLGEFSDTELFLELKNVAKPDDLISAFYSECEKFDKSF